MRILATVDEERASGVAGGSRTAGGNLEMVAEGEVEFVARRGEFIPLAARLVERRLRWAWQAGSSSRRPGRKCQSTWRRFSVTRSTTALPGSWATLNSAFSWSAVARSRHTKIKTVVELAVRLRETIRRLSDAWDSQPRLPKPAEPRPASAFRRLEEYCCDCGSSARPSRSCGTGFFQQRFEVFSLSEIVPPAGPLKFSACLQYPAMDRHPARPCRRGGLRQ